MGQKEIVVAMEGSVSKVEMMAPMSLTYKWLFPSISTFETLPSADNRLTDTNQTAREGSGIFIRSQKVRDRRL